MILPSPVSLYPSEGSGAFNPVMRQILLLLSFLLFSVFTTLQAQTRQHEIGVRAPGLDNFDFLYKRSAGANRFLRFRLLTVNSQYETTASEGLRIFNLGAAAGLEWRNGIADDFTFIHGPELSLAGSTRKNDNRDAWDLTARVGYVLGFNYLVSNKFVVGLEMIPRVSYRFSEPFSGERQESVNVGFSTNYVALTALYRFSRQTD